MFTTIEATAASRSVGEQIAASLLAAIVADSKTLYQIAKDAGIVYGDLLQFLGTNGNTPASPYTQAQKTCTLQFAAQVAKGLTDTTPFVINLGFELAPTSSSLTGGTHAVVYAGSVTFAVTNGATPITYAVVAGTLPAGMSLNASTGAFTGTPTTAATYNFTIEGTDHNNVKARRAYSIVIA